MLLSINTLYSIVALTIFCAIVFFVTKLLAGKKTECTKKDEEPAQKNDDK